MEYFLGVTKGFEVAVEAFEGIAGGDKSNDAAWSLFPDSQWHAFKGERSTTCVCAIPSVFSDVPLWRHVGCMRESPRQCWQHALQWRHVQ